MQTGKKIVFVLGILLSMLILSAGCEPLPSDSGFETATPEAQDEGEAQPEPQSGDNTGNDEPASDEPKLTSGQENAIGAAESYLRTGAFSREGLIEQLRFEGYSKKNATFAVDYLNVDWKDQAVKAAKEYLEVSHFSKSGLIEQLKFEGFTPEEARHGANRAL